MQSDLAGRFAFIIRTHIAIAALTAVVVGSVCAPAVAQDQVREGADVSLNNSMPFEQRGVTVEQNLSAQVPLNLQLKDSLGRRAQTGYFFDGKKPTIVTLNYSNCPMLCNIQLNKLVQSLNKLDLQLGQDFQMLTVSIDPTESTERIRETKQKYVDLLTEQPGAEQGWEFCTAKEPIIRRLADVLGFRYKYDRANKQYNHPAMLAYISPEGVISRYSLDIEFPPKQMKLALLEAGEGKVGSRVDQFILWCYSYDPKSNSYTPMAFRIMKIGGAATVFLMMACLAPYWIGRRKSPETSLPEADSLDAVDDAEATGLTGQPNNELTD